MTLYYYFSSLIEVTTVQFERFFYHYSSLRSKHFRGAKSEERVFRRFARAKNGARAKKKEGESNDSGFFLFLKTHRNTCYVGYYYSNDENFLLGYLTAGETYTDVLKCIGATFDLRQCLRELLKSQS